MGFPLSLDTPIAHPGPLPAEADVVVIGAGIIGVMTAWELARAGLRVVVLEKGRVAAEQSSRNWGWIRQQGRHPAEMPIMIEANRLWRDLAARLGDGLGLRQAGVVYLASGPGDEAKHAAFLQLARDHGLDTEAFSRADLARVLPGAVGGWTGGIRTASDMHAEPAQAVPLLARAAAADGVVIVEHCAVRLIDVAGGRVAGAITEQGRIRAPAVVVAGGAWSSLLLRRHGIVIPQLAVRATVAATVPLPAVTEGAVADNRLGWRRRQDGGYTLGPDAFHQFHIGPDAFRHLRAYLPTLMQDFRHTSFLPVAPQGYPDGWRTPRRWSGEGPSPFEALRVLNPAPHMPVVAQMARDLAATYPDLGEVRIARAWSGMIDTMPDVVPVIDHAPSLPGLTIATGMSGHGFGIGPAFGRIVAALVQGHETGHDLHAFRFSRFSDGTRIDAGAGM